MASSVLSILTHSGTSNSLMDMMVVVGSPEGKTCFADKLLPLQFTSIHIRESIHVFTNKFIAICGEKSKCYVEHY